MNFPKRRIAKEFTTRRRAGRSARRLSLGLTLLEDRSLLSITLQFDYSRDTSGFFAAHPEAKVALSQAAAEVSGFITDTLTQIPASPVSGSNTWTAVFFEPTTGASTVIPGPFVPANTLLIYAGARQLHTGSSGELAEAGAGGFGIQYDNQAYHDNVVGRGNPGALGSTPTKFTPWGGSIAFDNLTDWDFSVDALPASGKQSFFQTAEHEIGHLLGIGAAIYQWQHWISAGTFHGPSAMAVNGGQPIAVDPAAGHWANSTVVDGIVPAMVPIVRTNPPNLFSPLDYAALRDIGWSPLVTDTGGASFTAQATVDHSVEGGDVSLKITPGPTVRGLNVVHIKTVDGTAVGGVNYQAVDDYLYFYPWDGPKTVTIHTIADGKPTVDLNFSVQLLYSETGNSGTPGSVNFTVVNGDAGNRAPTLDPIPQQSGTVGTLFTYTAHATDVDVGQTITYSLGPGAPAGAVIASATGKLTFTPTQAGITYQIPIVATDNGNPSGSDTKTLVLVTQPNQPVSVTLQLTPSKSSAVFGEPVTFSLAANSTNGIPTGSVALFDGTTVIATKGLDASGRAEFSIATLPVGAHSLSARYDGDAGHLGATSSNVGVTVSIAPTRLDLGLDVPRPVVGQVVTLTATPVPSVAGRVAPTGTVRFLDNGKLIRTVPLVNGVASMTTSFGDTKTKHSFTAIYSGDFGFASAKSAAVLPAVTPASVGIGFTTVTTGTGAKTSVRFSVAVAASAPGAGVPSGSVSILANNRVVATAKLVNGRAVLTALLSKLTGKSLVLSYSGEARFLARKSNPFTV